MAKLKVDNTARRAHLNGVLDGYNRIADYIVNIIERDEISEDVERHFNLLKEVIEAEIDYAGDTKMSLE